MSRADIANTFVARAVSGGGRSAPKGKTEAVLLDHVSANYRPTIPLWGWNADTLGLWTFFFDIEAMLIAPAVHVSLDVVKAPVSVAEFTVTASSPDVKAFAEDQTRHWWDKCVPEILEGAYPYGWAGGEVVYADSGKNLHIKELASVAPRDVSPLTYQGHRVGVRMKNVMGGSCDLWLGSDTVPAKGFWYRHRPRHGNHYGRSQLISAWREWKRLHGRDGAQELSDLGAYRFALGNWLIRYPNEKVRTANDGEKNARDTARELGETLKTGGSVEMPGTKYPQDQGGHYKWELEHIAPNTKLAELADREDRLVKAIKEAIGNPPELLEASETGSGFSGRMIPMQTFLLMRQREVTALMESYVETVLRPLARWNYGPHAWVEVKVVPLLQTFRKLFAPQPVTGVGGFAGASAAQPGLPGGGQSTVGNIGQGDDGTPDVGRPSPEQVMAAVLQAQQEATSSGDPHRNDAEIQQLLDLLPGRQKNAVKDGYVGGISRRHHMKAVGVGQNAGHIAYGREAKRLLGKQGAGQVPANRVKAALGDGPHSYASTQFNLDGEAAALVEFAQAIIHPNDLTGDGCETEPHVTILYGLHDDDPQEVWDAVVGFGPVTFRIGNPNVFEGASKGKPYDVVMFDVLPAFGEGKDRLWRLNEMLANLPHTDTHGEYHPHATVAYVQAGKGRQYADRIQEEMGNNFVRVTTDRLIFSARDGTRTVLLLGGEGPRPSHPIAIQHGVMSLNGTH